MHGAESIPPEVGWPLAVILTIVAIVMERRAKR